MRKSTALVAVTALFVLAWFAFPERRPYAAGQVRVEIPNAAAPAFGQKWEYATIIVDSNAIAVAGQQHLNAHGKQGWELCEAVSHETQTSLVMKRPLK
jgi:hypothetical protein